MFRKETWAIIRFEKPDGAAKALCADDVKILDVTMVIKRHVQQDKKVEEAAYVEPTENTCYKCNQKGHFANTCSVVVEK